MLAHLGWRGIFTEEIYAISLYVARICNAFTVNTFSEIAVTVSGVCW